MEERQIKIDRGEGLGPGIKGKKDALSVIFGRERGRSVPPIKTCLGSWGREKKGHGTGREEERMTEKNHQKTESGTLFVMRKVEEENFGGEIGRGCEDDP